MQALPSYVLLTAARNEADHLGKLLQSVVGQTAKPVRWIVISDGSSDGTDELVKAFEAHHPWIGLHRLTQSQPRDFTAWARCMKRGYELLRNSEFELIGNVNADVSFPTDYFEFLLGRFAEDPKLGVAGTSYMEGTNCSTSSRFADLSNVSGQCQIFRRQCFEAIGGFRPVKEGGADTIAVMMAKAEGWKTRTFVEKTFCHHRRMGAWTGGPGIAAFRAGYRDYLLGNHPLWQFARSLYLMSKSPLVLGGLLNWSGYLVASVSRRNRNMPQNCVQLRRREQMQRLSTIGKSMVR